MKKTRYPFSAVVGQKPLKRALIVNAVDPTVGGVLVLGPRGTGKSTLVRGLTNVLPDQSFVEGCPFRCPPGDQAFECPFCDDGDPGSLREAPPRMADLPLGATADQLVGTLNVEAAVREGRRRFQPGILARAHRGILYVDEVNLLPDRLVDLILDAAASGVNRVERDGVSFRHPADFLLVGTMNPEEGMLRPQLTDRFGLGVVSETLTDPEKRVELSRRVERFDRDPEGFRRDWADREGALRDRVKTARERLGEVSLDEQDQRRIARVLMERNVEGHRADVVARKTARALAAWEGRTAVAEQDVEEALRLALLHRDPDPSDPPSGPNGGDSPRAEPDGPFSESENGGPDPSEHRGEDRPVPPEEDPARGREPPRLDPPEGPSPTPRGFAPGTAADGGSPLRRPGRRGNRLDLARSLLQQSRRVIRGGTRSLCWEDLRFRPRDGVDPVLRVFVVDTSASMAEAGRLGRLKGYLLGRLRERDVRDRAALLEFRGAEGRLLLEPTERLTRVRRALNRLPAGGGTPAARGLRFARRWLETLPGRPRPRVEITLCSDGRFPVDEGVLEAMVRLGRQGRLRLLDVGEADWGALAPLADRLGCPYHRPGDRVA